MYPYVDQLLAWRANSPDEKIGGLVLEVKGDFCTQVRAMLERLNRRGDYVEIGLESPYCYNPLHNDLEPYALAYSIATLLNNLYGRGKEPFWQQAYTDLLKFVISLRRITTGYTTLSEVYRYIIEDDLIRLNIKELTEEAKVSVRNVRRDGNKAAEQAEKDGDLTEDLRDKLKEDIQELTKKYEGLAADMAKKREDEVMEG